MFPSSSALYFLISLTVLLRTFTSHAQFCDNTVGNFTPNTAYAKNRDAALSYLSYNVAANDGICATSQGENPNTVYAIAYCRGDTSADICAICVRSAVENLAVKCPNQKAAFSWGTADPPCFIRYSNISIFGVLQTQPTLEVKNAENITLNQDQFGPIWRNLTQRLAEEAGEGSSKLKFAEGQANLPDNKTIYALLQCSPDLSPMDCGGCLHESIDDYDKCCRGSKGGVVYKPSCNFRWDLFQFWGSSPSSAASSLPSLAAPPPPHDTYMVKGKNNKSTVIVVAISVPIAGVLVLLFITCCLLRRKGKRTYGAIKGKKGTHELTTMESLQFDWTTIRAATNDFSLENKLGEGGFGEVFKGRLPNGQDIAVKRLSQGFRQDTKEFKNEVMLVAYLQHRNLVQLLGYCVEGEEKILVYEFVPNKSLDYFLYDPKKCLQLDWLKRHEIVCGIARGMLYLHQDSRLRIIHRDLKASNILLDSGMNPKIADFGTARIFGVNQTHASTRKIVGTLGYMPPEYARNGKFSIKSDVYSFGVLLLEIISGKKNDHLCGPDGGEDLASYAWRHWGDGTSMEVLDPTVLDLHSRDEMLRCLHISLLCVQENPVDRPTMVTILHMLSNQPATIPQPRHPAFFPRSRSLQQSINEVTITELDPR